MHLIEQFEKRTEILDRPKLQRWTSSPLRYAYGLSQRYILNDLFSLSACKTCTLFTGDSIEVLLPSGLDLYLTGIKAHESEIRLVRFILKTMPGLLGDSGLQWAIDCGAHLGYFTTILARLFGHVDAFEPTSYINALLKKNTERFGNVAVLPMAISSTPGTVVFYEHAPRYSEYNSTKAAGDLEKTKVMREVTSIDRLAEQRGSLPDFVKIDVEGGEYDVFLGAENVWTQDHTIFAFEVRLEGYDELYLPLMKLLDESSYRLYGIDDQGAAVALNDMRKWIQDRDLESDNFLFIPTNKNPDE